MKNNENHKSFVYFLSVAFSSYSLQRFGLFVCLAGPPPIPAPFCLFYKKNCHMARKAYGEEGGKGGGGGVADPSY